MRMLHEVIEDLRGLPDQELTPLGSALEELLGGERGSLADLGERFTQAGLSHILNSWIGDAPVLPIRPHDLRRVLGDERVGDLATLSGLPPDDFLIRFARLLPSAVRAMMTEPEA